MTPGTRRTAFSLVLFFTACGFGGIVASRSMHAQGGNGDGDFRDSLKQFAAVYSTVSENYADPFTGDKPSDAIYDGAIPAMLRTLDPHSNFFDPKSYSKLLEEQRGRYYGVGMMIQPQLIGDKQRTVVLKPFAGTPSYKAGIHPGDIITAVDDKTTDGLNSDDVVGLLKGDKGTHVKVTVARAGATPGNAETLSFDLVRAEIPNNSVDLAYQIQPGLGYIHIKAVQETTGKEVSDALDSFGDVKGLVLDLRDNPGGLLNQAVAVCDQFLQRGQTIVSQRGRAYPEQLYRANHGNGGKNYPIVVLTNHGTASAAEIISGALQDHDRGLILGTTTFGKGLVQTVYQLSENTGLTLTTYHYYTPSGRLIQRNYEGVSLYDYYSNHGKPQDQKDREVKQTDSGRTEYGGDGIAPDVPFEEPKPVHVQRVLLAHYTFFDFAQRYLAKHQVAKDAQVTPAMVDEFKQFLHERNVAYTDAELNPVLDWVKASILAELLNTAYTEEDGARARAQYDPEIKKAVSVMNQAAQLEQAAEQAAAAKQAAHSNLPSTM
ncbi:S41 family peptidase [Acidipila sp. EB88]|nr:S41 family peptidase [Acidipila sp. EB88]